MATLPPAPSLHLLRETPLGVPEASGVAALADGRFLVVDDETGLFRCELGRDPELLHAAPDLEDLEGVCIAPSGDPVYLLGEAHGEVRRLTLSTGHVSELEPFGHLPRLSDEANKGWEGITVAPAGSLSDAPLLVAVHQARPRRVGLFDLYTIR